MSRDNSLAANVEAELKWDSRVDADHFEPPDVFGPRREPPDVEVPGGTRDFDRLYAAWPDEPDAIGWYEAHVEMERDPERPPPSPEAQACPRLPPTGGQEE